MKYLLVRNSWFSRESFLKDAFVNERREEKCRSWTHWDSNRLANIPVQQN